MFHYVVFLLSMITISMKYVAQFKKVIIQFHKNFPTLIILFKWFTLCVTTVTIEVLHGRR